MDESRENGDEVLIGMTEDAAVKMVEASGLTARITGRDDESFICTCDYRLDRINFVIKNGKVVSTDRG